MILSNIEIQKALDNKRLIITPEPTPRRKIEGKECPYATTAVDLRLGNEISYFNDDFDELINLHERKFDRLYSRNSTAQTITNEQPFHLVPNRFVIGKTLEIVELPFSQKRKRWAWPFKKSTCLAARVEGKSSHARCGLIVHFTAPTIHAGFQGTITLEFINLGPGTIVLTPGMFICQLILEEVQGDPFRNDSQFHGQTKAGGGSN